MSTDTYLNAEDEQKLNRIESELDRIEREVREGVREAVAEAVREHGADDVDAIADEVFDSIDGVDAANAAPDMATAGSFSDYMSDESPDAVNASEEDDGETGGYHGSFRSYAEQHD